MRPNAMTIKQAILTQIQQIASDQKISLVPLTDETVLNDSGLDSLGFAILVTRLEDELGLDPFTTSDEITFPITLREFVQVYEDASRQS
jgi:acyl carrier protein